MSSDCKFLGEAKDGWRKQGASILRFARGDSLTYVTNFVGHDTSRLAQLLFGLAARTPLPR